MLFSRSPFFLLFKLCICVLTINNFFIFPTYALVSSCCECFCLTEREKYPQSSYDATKSLAEQTRTDTTAFGYPRSAITSYRENVNGRDPLECEKLSESYASWHHAQENAQRPCRTSDWSKNNSAGFLANHTRPQFKTTQISFACYTHSLSSSGIPPNTS